MILLDTSVLSRVFRRRRVGPEEKALQVVFDALISSDAPLGLPGVVLQEVLSGMASEKQFRELRSKLLGAFSIVPATVEDHLEAARLRNLCLTAGTNVSGIDCLIAATSIAGEHELFTLDTDFIAISKHSKLRLFRDHEGA